MSELEQNKIRLKLSSRGENRWHEHEQETKDKLTCEPGVKYIWSVKQYQDSNKAQPHTPKRSSLSSPSELLRRNSRWDIPPTQHERDGKLIPTLKQPVLPYQSRFSEHKNSYDPKKHDQENRQNCSEGTLNDLEIDISSDDNNNHNSDSNNNNDDVNDRNNYDRNHEVDVNHESEAQGCELDGNRYREVVEKKGAALSPHSKYFRSLIHTADSSSSLIELDIAERFASLSSEICKEDSPATKRSDSVHNARLKENRLAEVDFDIEHYPGVNVQELVKSKDLNIKLVKRNKHDQRMEREKCRRLEWRRFVQPKDTDSDGVVSSMLQQDPQPDISLKLTNNVIVTSSCAGARTTFKRKSVDIIEDMRTLIESKREKRAHHEISHQKQYKESRGYSLDKKKIEIRLKTTPLRGECQENAQSMIKQVGKELSKRASEQECLQKLSGETETNQKPLEGLPCKVKFERGLELTGDSKLIYLSKMNHLKVSSEAFEVRSNCVEKTVSESETESLSSSVASDKSFPSNEEALHKLIDIQEEIMTDGSDCHQKESIGMHEGREASAVFEALPVEFIVVGDGRNSEEDAVPSSSSKQGMEYHQDDCDQTKAKQEIVSSVTETAVICKPSDSGAMETSGEMSKSEDRLIESEEKNSKAEEVTSEENEDGLHLESDIIIIEEKIMDRTCRQIKKDPIIDSDDISIVFESLGTKPVIPSRFCDELPNKPECSTEDNISESDGAIVKKENFSDVLIGNKIDSGVRLSSGAKEWMKIKSNEDISSISSSMERCDVCDALGRIEFTEQTTRSTHQANSFVHDKTDGKNSQSDKLSNFLEKRTEQISCTSSCFSETTGHLDGGKITDNEKNFKQGRNLDGNVIALKVSIEKHRLFSRKSREVLMGKLDSCLEEKANHCMTKAESSIPTSDSVLGIGNFTEKISSLPYNNRSPCERNLDKDISHSQRRTGDLLGDLNCRERKEISTCLGSKSSSGLLSENALNCYSVSEEAKNVAHVCHTNQLPDHSNCYININNNTSGNNKEIRLPSPSDGVLATAVSTRTHVSIQRELECNEILVESCIVHDKNDPHSNKEPQDGLLIIKQNSNILPGDVNPMCSSSKVFRGVKVPSSVKKSSHEVSNDLGGINGKGMEEETVNIVSSDGNDTISRTKAVETETFKGLCEIQTEKNPLSDLQEYSRNCEDEVLLTMNNLEATTKTEEKSCKIDTFKHQYESGVHEKMPNLGNLGKVLDIFSSCIEGNKLADKSITELDHANCEQNLFNSAESTLRTCIENDEEYKFTSKMCASHSEEPHLPYKRCVPNKIDLESDTETFSNKESLPKERSGNLGSLLLVRQYGDECEQVEDNQIKYEENMEFDKDCVECQQDVLNCYSEQPSKQGNLTDDEPCQVFQQNCNIDSDVLSESHMAKSDHDLWMSYENISKNQPSNQCSTNSLNRNDESLDHLPFNCEYGILNHSRKCCCSAKHQFSISQSVGLEGEQETACLKVKPHCDHSLCSSVSDDELCSILTGKRKQISTSLEQRKHDHGKFEVYLEEQNSGTIGRCPDMHQVERDHTACCSRQERRRLSYDSREEPFAFLPKRKRRQSALVLQLDSALVQKSLTQAMARLHAGSDFDVPCKQCGKFARHHVDGKCVFRPRHLSKKCREYWDPDCFKKPNVIPGETSVEKNPNDVFTSEGDGNSSESVVKLASSNLGLEDIEALDKIVEECGITLYEPRPNPPSQVVLPIDSMCTTKLVCTQTSVEQLPNFPNEKIQDQYSTGYRVFPSPNHHTCDLAPVRDPRLEKLASSDAFRGGSLLSTSSALSGVSNANCLACAYDPEHPIISSPESILTKRIASDQKSRAGSLSKISKTKRKLILPNELDAPRIKPCDLDCSSTYLKTAQRFQRFQKPPRTPSPPYPSSPTSPLSSMSPISPQSYPSPLSSLSSIPPPPTPPNLSLELCTVSQPERHQSKTPLPIPATPNLNPALCTVIQPEKYQSNPPLHPLSPTPKLNHELCTVTQPERYQSNLPPLPLKSPNLCRELCTITQPEMHQSSPPLPPLLPTPPKSSFESCSVTKLPIPPPCPPPSQIPLPPLPPTPKTSSSRPPLLSHHLFHGYDSSGNRGIPISAEQCDWSQMMSQKYEGNNQSSHSEPYASCAYNWRTSQSHLFTKNNITSQSFLTSGDNAQGLSGTPHDWSYTSSVTYSQTTWPLQTQNANAISHQQINEQSHRWQYGSRTVPSSPHTAHPPQPSAPGEA